MKKRLCMLVTALLLTSVSLSVFANNSILEGYLTQSIGRFIYDTDKSGIAGDNPKDVVYDADDLAIIQNMIEEGKNILTESINNYPTKKVEEKTFENIATAIDNLSKIPAGMYFYDKTTATDDASELVCYIKESGAYYLCDKNGNKISDIIQTPNQSNLVEYSEITQENIAIGHMGMIDKKIILGDGYNEVIQYQESFSEGYIDGFTEESSNVKSIDYVYHVHSGTPDENGGCYTKPVYHTHTGDAESRTGCYSEGICKKIEGVTIESYSLNCGKTESSIEEAVIIYN